MVFIWFLCCFLFVCFCVWFFFWGGGGRLLGFGFGFVFCCFFFFPNCAAKSLFSFSLKLSGEHHFIWNPKGEASTHPAMLLPDHGSHVPLGGCIGSFWSAIWIILLLKALSSSDNYFRDLLSTTTVLLSITLCCMGDFSCNPTECFRAKGTQML